jgi:hypothetical protein
MKRNQVEIKQKEPTYSMYAGVNGLLTTQSIALDYTASTDRMISE